MNLKAEWATKSVMIISSLVSCLIIAITVALPVIYLSILIFVFCHEVQNEENEAPESLKECIVDETDTVCGSVGNRVSLSLSDEGETATLD